MKRARRTIPAAAFKTHCLALLDEVKATGETLIVTKRGKPVAKVVPSEDVEPKPLRGSVRYHGDIVAPIDEPWDATR
ncbi:MAG: hypothetical protein A2V77_09765 [Anaeromyxobacter sp. RBG_16_69_14]|nr:MAG: hypothetical protein A2V77_09765 [Anaeromyxobacter sp. RBG_16_69_14]